MKKPFIFLLSLLLGLVLSTLLAAPTPSLAQDVRPIPLPGMICWSKSQSSLTTRSRRSAKSNCTRCR